jgi:hypothetical protein
MLRRNFPAFAVALFGCASEVIPDLNDGSERMHCESPAGTTVHEADFSPNSFRSQWTVDAVGTAPAFTLSAGLLTMTDASFAVTPSAHDARSWIYDPDVDRGNQMAWPQGIGTRPFRLDFHLSWASSRAQVTLAGIAVTDRANSIEAYAGFSDPWGNAFGARFAAARVESGPMNWTGEMSADGDATFRFVRQEGHLSIAINGRVIQESTRELDVANIAIFAVRHRDIHQAYEFGTVSIDHLRVCY